MTSPERRLRHARIVFWASLVLTPPSVWITLVNPKAGAVVLMVVSYLAITLTAWDVLQTADVRNQQERDD